MKIMLMGYARHGKDTVAQLLLDHLGLTYKDSSFTCAELAIYPILKDLIGYDTIEECYNDRHNHRALWYELIKAYNHQDKSRLAREIFQESDVYVGIRNVEEFYGAQAAGLFDAAIWVDASQRLGAEDQSSCTVGPQHANLIISNNSTLKDLESRVRNLGPLVNSLQQYTFDVGAEIL